MDGSIARIRSAWHLPGWKQHRMQGCRLRLPPSPEKEPALPVTDTDLAAMRLAIAASRQALDAGDMPSGAALLSPAGQLSTQDCSAHAEMVLVRRATEQLGAASLQGATVYASGEPCAMCAGALFWAGVGRVVFAAAQPDMAALLGGPLLPTRCADLLGAATPPVAVTGGVLADEAMAVLRDATAP
jgi:tRNA(Arg) A34 adenosine deaminase TadA